MAAKEARSKADSVTRHLQFFQSYSNLRPFFTKEIFCPLQVQELTELDEESLLMTLSYANYYIDCHDPGSWADRVAIE